MALFVVERGFSMVAPFRHALLVLDGTISPSTGNLGVVAGEFGILAGIALLAFVFLLSGARILEGSNTDADP